MFGLGKPRTKLGAFLDREGISQTEFGEESGLDRNTVSRLCSNKEHEPYESTAIRVVRTLRKMGYDVTIGDFW